MGRKFSGHRPEDQPVFTNPRNQDYEKRRLFFTDVYSPAPTPPAKVGREYVRVKNTSGGALAVGDVVVIKAATELEVTTTTTEGDPLVLGMVAQIIANNAYGLVQIYGKTTFLKVNGTDNIAIGDFIGTFTTAKIGMKATLGKTAFAVALEAYTADDSNGVIDAFIITPRQVGVGHERQHTITSTGDHTSEATEGQILQADVNGLPVDASNTDTEVADAVSKLGGIEEGADVTANHPPQAHAASHAVGEADTVFPADPGADRVLGWDDSESELIWQEAGGMEVHDNTYHNPDYEEEGVAAGLVSDHAALTEIHGATGAVVGTTNSQVLTGKTLIATSNVVEEITTIASSATPTPTGGSLRNLFTVTALAEAATFAAPSGTPANSNKLIIRIKDNGTARTLAWNAIYAEVKFALPTTTVISETLYLGFIYNSADSKWDLVAIDEGETTAFLAHKDAATGVHNVGASIIASAADITTHADLKTSVHWADASGVLTFPSQSKVSVYLNAAQTITKATYTKILFDTEVEDIQSEFASNRFTAKTAGTYLVILNAVFYEIADGKIMFIYIYVNGASVQSSRVYAAGAAAYLSVLAMAAPTLAVGGYIEGYCYNDDPTYSRTCAAGATATNMTIIKIA